MASVAEGSAESGTRRKRVFRDSDGKEGRAVAPRSRQSVPAGRCWVPRCRGTILDHITSTTLEEQCIASRHGRLD